MADESRSTIALVIPVYNEEEVLPELFEALEAFRASHPHVIQVILVDDGSVDRSVSIIQEYAAGLVGYELVKLSRNFGHQLAITAGIAQVEADAAVVMDADLQDPLHVIDAMVEQWRDGYDVVYGVRTRREGESVFKRFVASAFYRFFRWMADVDMPVDTGDFRLISRKVIDTYNEIGDHQPFIRGLVSWMGFKQVGVQYVRAPRAAGESKYTFGKLLGLALSGLTSFSEKPLRIAVRLGLAAAVMSAVSFVTYLLVVLFSSAQFVTATVLIFTALFLGSVQLLFLGIIGIYLIRVYGEVKGRPRYIVADVWRSTRKTDPT